MLLNATIFTSYTVYTIIPNYSLRFKKAFIVNVKIFLTFTIITATIHPMRLKNIPGSREAIAASEYVIKEEAAEGVESRSDEKEVGRLVLGDWKVKGGWNKVFGNDRPIWIEIGMGKGTFLMEMAEKYPDMNFVGIEKYSSVLLRAVQKQETAQLQNVRFVRMDAEYICDVFAENEVAKIFLNFSDPWPKKRNAKRRLTSRQFMNRYDKILTSEGVVEFKTDNTALFDYSLEEIPEAGWQIIAYTKDLHNDLTMNEGNVMTEYEKKFSENGNKICKLISRR